MNDTITDPLLLKISEARNNLPDETINAIDSVDWKSAILGMRQKNGFTFEQLGILETETELLLCGLTDPEDYPNEIQNRLGIGEKETETLMMEMNNSIFQKINEEFIKNIEKTKNIKINKEEEIEYQPQKSPIINHKDNNILDLNEYLDGEKETETFNKIKPLIIPETHDLQEEKLEITGSVLKTLEIPKKENSTNDDLNIHPLLAQKFSQNFESNVVHTDHSLNNITKTNNTNPTTPVKQNTYPPKADPYRLSPDE